MRGERGVVSVGSHSGAGVREAGGWIGDVVLRFGCEEGAAGRFGDVGWEEVRSEEGRVEVQPATATWKGFPAKWLAGANGDWGLLVGELYGSALCEGDDEKLVSDLMAGRARAADLNGHFLLFGWDAASKQWHVWTDRFGTVHCYHGRSGERAALSTSFASAAGVSRRRLDWLGLSGFFAVGFFPDDRTFFEDVRILEPACHYVFGRTGQLLRHGRYWEWFHEPDRRRSYDATLGALDDVLREVLSEQTRNARVALPISGGLDSRTTVAVLSGGNREGGRQGELWSYSYGYSDDSAETRIASRVAAARGLPFEAITVRPYLFDEMDRVLGCVEGFQDITQSRQATALERIASHADYVLAAHWGDVWLDDMGWSSRQDGGDDEHAIVAHTLRRLLKQGRGWLLEHVCEAQLNGGSTEEGVVESLRTRLGGLRHVEDPDFRVKALKTDQWSFRWTLASLRMFQPAAFPRLPFYDTRLADFCCTVPSEHVRGRRLQVDYLRRRAPDLARIAWQATGRNLFDHDRSDPMKLPRRALRKLWRGLSGRAVIQRNWEVQFLGPEGRVGLEPWLLRKGLRLHEFVAPTAVRTLLDDFYADPFAKKRGYTVSMLLTFSAWLENYA